MNFRTVTVLIATFTFNVFATDAAYQKGFDVAASAYNNYDQQSNLYPQGGTANSQILRQYVNPPSNSVFGSTYSSDPYQGTYPSAYPGSYQIGSSIYPVQEEGVISSFISTIKNIIIRVVTFPFKIIHTIKGIISTIFSIIVSPIFRQTNTIGYPL